MKGLLSLALIALIMGAAYFFYQSQQGSQPSTPSSQSAQPLEMSEAWSQIHSTTSSERQKYNALLRLAKAQDQRALSQAVDWLDSDTTPLPLKQASLLALGHLKGAEVTKKLLQYTGSDSPPPLRMEAIEALGRQGSSEAQAALTELLQASHLGHRELAEVYLALITTSSPQDQESHLKRGLTIYESLAADEQLSFLSRLLHQAPEAPQVVDFVRKLVYTGHEAKTQALAIRHLAASKDEWVASQFMHLLSSGQPPVKKAVISSIHYLCPENQWELLKQALTSSHDMELAELALKEALQLNHQKALRFFSELKADPSVPEGRVELIDSVQSKIKSTPSSCP